MFDVQGGSLALSGLTITGGRADDGGGIRNGGGRLALTRHPPRQLRPVLGGGLLNDGTATLRNVTVTGNQGADPVA